MIGHTSSYRSIKAYLPRMNYDCYYITFHSCSLCLYKCKSETLLYMLQNCGYYSERKLLLLLKLSIRNTVPDIPCAYYQLDTNVLVVYIIINPYTYHA